MLYAQTINSLKCKQLNDLYLHILYVHFRRQIAIGGAWIIQIINFLGLTSSFIILGYFLGCMDPSSLSQLIKVYITKQKTHIQLLGTNHCIS